MTIDDKRLAEIKARASAVITSRGYKISYTIVLDDLAQLGEEVPDLAAEVERLRAHLAELNAAADSNIHLDLVCGAAEHEGNICMANGGCGVAFKQELTYRCADCNVVFHRACARTHFREHQNAPDATIARLRTIVDESCGMQPADLTPERLLTMLERHLFECRKSAGENFVRLEKIAAAYNRWANGTNHASKTCQDALIKIGEALGVPF